MQMCSTLPCILHVSFKVMTNKVRLGWENVEVSTCHAIAVESRVVLSQQSLVSGRLVRLVSYQKKN